MTCPRLLPAAGRRRAIAIACALAGLAAAPSARADLPCDTPSLYDRCGIVDFSHTFSGLVQNTELRVRSATATFNGAELDNVLLMTARTGGPDKVAFTGTNTFTGAVFFGYTAESVLEVSNTGTIVQRGNGQLNYFARSAQPFVNDTFGTYFIANDLGLQGEFGFLNRNASLIKSDGVGISHVGLRLEQQNGKVESWRGTLSLDAGGSHNDSRFFAGLAGTVPASVGIAFGGAHAFTGTTLTDIGNFAVNAGATIDVSGTWNQQAQLANAGTVGFRLASINSGARINLGGGLVNTGTLDAGEAHGFGTQLAVDGSLTNATGGVIRGLGMSLAGRFTNSAGARVIEGGITSQAGSVLVNDGTMQLTQAHLDGSVTNNGTLVISEPAGGPGRGTLLNTGTMVIASGADPQLQSFSQTAGSLTVDGSLDTFGGDVAITGGSLDGTGLINPGVTLADGTVTAGDLVIGGGPGFAFFRPGHSPGTMTIAGGLVMAANSELDLEVERRADGSLALDQVVANAFSFQSGSRLRFIVGAGVADGSAQSLRFFDCSVGCDFADGVQFTIDGAPGAAVVFGDDGGLTLQLAAVPEPGSAALWLGGLLLLCSATTGRRRMARAAPALSRP